MLTFVLFSSKTKLDVLNPSLLDSLINSNAPMYVAPCDPTWMLVPPLLSELAIDINHMARGEQGKASRKDGRDKMSPA